MSGISLEGNSSLCLPPEECGLHFPESDLAAIEMCAVTAAPKLKFVAIKWRKYLGIKSEGKYRRV